MQRPLQFNNCPLLNSDTRQPARKTEDDTLLLTSKLMQISVENMDENNNVYDVTIEKVNKNGKTVYHIIPTEASINPVEISEQDFMSISAQYTHSSNKPVTLAMYDPIKTSYIKAKMKITHANCESALKSETIIFQTKSQVNPSQANPVEPAKKSVPLPTNEQNPKQEIDNTIFSERFNLLAPHPTEIKDIDIAQLFKNLSPQQKQQVIEIFNPQRQKIYYAKLSQCLEGHLDTLHNILNELDNKFVGHGQGSILHEEITKKKDEQIQIFAQELVTHYWKQIETNDDLDRPTFEQYCDILKTAMRKRDCELSKKQDGDGPLFTRLNEVMGKTGPIITKHEEILTSLLKQKKDTLQKTNDQFKTDIQLALIAPLQQATAHLAMQETGQLIASSILSCFNNPDIEKEQSELKEEIEKVQKKLKKNSPENQTKKQNKILFKATEENQKLLDEYDNKRKKPTKEELLQKVKDLHAQ
jgi:hypothetical protein